MNETEVINPTRVTVSFHSSSAKDGREAYNIQVLEGATEEEAVRVMALAKKLRGEAIAALQPDRNEVIDRLEQSLSNGKRA